MKQTIGILGGGQLGRLLAQAAHNLGFDVVVLDPTPSSPAGQITKQIVGSFKDEQKIRELALECDFITFEIELANSKILQELEAQGKIIHPSPATLGIIKNKFGQKQILRAANIPVADFVEVKSREDILQAAHTFDYPIVLKAKFDAYDGRGNALIESQDDIERAMEKLKGRELYAEKFVVFEKELAVTAARGADGSISVYPVFETIHQNQICHTVLCPANIHDETKQQARDLAIRTLEHLKGVGVFCVEMFHVPNSPPLQGGDDFAPGEIRGGSVLVNEIAPRVHNAGHLTIEACHTSQFENHIRAITGMELGATNLKVPASVMMNILGERNGTANFGAFDGTWGDFAKQHKLPQTQSHAAAEIFVHIYGKMETKVERKMGHITVLADDAESAIAAAKQARNLINI